MSDVVITLSDKEPSPPRADFGFEIDFLRVLDVLQTSNPPLEMPVGGSP